MSSCRSDECTVESDSRDGGVVDVLSERCVGRMNVAVFSSDDVVSHEV